MRNKSEILADALALFEGGRNWMKRRLWDDDDDAESMDLADFQECAASAQNFCAYGAIMKSMALHGERKELSVIRKEYYGEAYDEDNESIPQTYRNLLTPGNSIVNVNDADNTTFEDIKAMFCTGINRALEEEAAEAAVAEPETPLINPVVGGDSPTATGPSCRLDPATGLVLPTTSTRHSVVCD